jgi:hypothetical protein
MPEEHTRRVEDFIKVVQRTVDEVNQYLQTGEGGPERKRVLMQQQTSAMNALQLAIKRQQEVLASGQLPGRRATDVAEDQEVLDIQRRAGIKD